MQARKKIVQSVAFAMGLMVPVLAIANSEENLPSPVLLAQAGSSQQGLIFDASQISPLGDPAWVASLRGPDPSRPSLNIGAMDASAPVTGVGEKDRLPDGMFRRGDATVRNGQVLNNGRVFLIGAERSTLSKAGSILLAPGRAAELGDLRVPFVRVYVAAPSGNALDVDRLISQRPAIGMFNALFTPAPARRGDNGATAIAAVAAPAASPDIVVVHATANPGIATAASMLAVTVAPVTERSVALLPIPPAQVEERMLIVYAAPVEDRSANLALIPPASVEDRSFMAYFVPVEERSGPVASIPLASVEDRSFITFIPLVEERSTLLASIPPASVEDRSFVTVVPSVEERSVDSFGAPATVQVARVEMDRVQVIEIGKPVPGTAIEIAAMESELTAAKKIAAPPSALVRVALSTTVVVVTARQGAAVPIGGESAPPPVKLAAVQKRLPSIMIDRKGGFFFM